MPLVLFGNASVMLSVSIQMCILLYYFCICTNSGGVRRDWTGGTGRAGLIGNLQYPDALSSPETRRPCFQQGNVTNVVYLIDCCDRGTQFIKISVSPYYGRIRPYFDGYIRHSPYRPPYPYRTVGKSLKWLTGRIRLPYLGDRKAVYTATVYSPRTSLGSPVCRKIALLLLIYFTSP
jgi:hypothetical protein